MKEIVQKVLEAEQEARESIDRAHADGQAIVRDAEHKSREVDERVRQKAIHEAQEIVERMKREAETERQRQLAEAQGARSELLSRKGAGIKSATERVVNLILGIEPR